jgi:hypothetical protein
MPKKTSLRKQRLPYFVHTHFESSGLMMKRFIDFWIRKKIYTQDLKDSRGRSNGFIYFKNNG